MPSILLTAPAAEPLSLADAKAYLRVAHDDDNDVIAALIAAARIHVEAATRRALINQTWRLVRDAWPRAGRIAVLPAPLRSLAAARIYDSDGVAQTIDLQSFVLDIAAAPGVIAFAPWSLAAPGRAIAGVELDVEVGFGAAVGDVPAPLRQAIRMLVAHWYENRGLAAFGEGAALLPANVGALIAPYRVVSL